MISKVGDECMHTESSIIDMVYAVNPESRSRSIFVCDHKTYEGLRRLVDSDGRFLWYDGLSTGDVSRLLGYPVHPDNRRAGLAFGEFEPLPESVEFYQKQEQPQ